MTKGQSRSNLLRTSAIMGTLCVTLFAGKAFAQSPTFSFDIPSEPLAAALHDFAKVTGQQIIFSPVQVAGKSTKPFKGTMTADEALSRLFVGTDLVVDRSSSAGLMVHSKNVQAASSEAAPTSPQGDNRSVESVLVTAEKKSERLQDTPVPITVLTGENLTETNEVRIQDFFSSVPGLNATPGDFHGSPMLSIRGITTGAGFTNPTVGVVVDDLPFGSSTGIGGGFQAPDIDPSDLDRVEVLRGPQGTLYGASSMGGLIKFVTIDPSTDGFSGRIEGGVDGIENGGGVGRSLRGAVNVPLSDSSAVRVSLYTRDEPGYIDNINTGQQGVNRVESQGGRVSFLYRLSGDWTVKLGALVQQTTQYGSPDVVIGPGLGDLQQNFLPRTGSYNTTFQAYNGTLTGKIGDVDVTSVTGFNESRSSDIYDFSAFIPNVPLTDNAKTHKFTEELRLSGSIWDNVDWLVGAFYTRETGNFIQDLFSTVPATGVRTGTLLDAQFPNMYEEYAGFADVTVHFTDRFNVQIGARESANNQSLTTTETGPDAGPAVPTATTHENSFTYLLTPQFQISSDLMVYARLASGYRPGGPNTNSALYHLPPTFTPDKTENYEVGAKGDVIPDILSFDASLYYIDWKNIQVQLQDAKTGAGYTSNAGAAKSEGVEFSLEAKPLDGLTIDAWVAYNDAELTQAFPATSSAIGAKGDVLPYGSPFSSNGSFTYVFPIVAGIQGTVGADFSYIGDRKGQFTSTPTRQDLPSYTKTDLRVGALFDTWTANLYVNNVTDERGVLTGGIGTFNPNAFNYIQPRTVGLTLSKTF